MPLNQPLVTHVSETNSSDLGSWSTMNKTLAGAGATLDLVSAWGFVLSLGAKFGKEMPWLRVVFVFVFIAGTVMMLGARSREKAKEVAADKSETARWIGALQKLRVEDKRAADVQEKTASRQGNGVPRSHSADDLITLMARGERTQNGVTGLSQTM
jgi:hypothetical protein